MVEVKLRIDLRDLKQIKVLSNACLKNC